MTRSRAVLLAFVAVALLASAPAASAAQRGACRDDGTGPRCQFWTATVIAVDDGDTVKVDIDGDGRSRIVKVRLTGINAMEQSVYSSRPERRRGACHALEATRRLERLVRGSGRKVRLGAQHASSRTGKRLRRQLSVRVGGRWTDAGAILMAEGHALWLPNQDEWAWNKQYSALARQASLRGRNLWDTDACGAGPQQEVPVRVSVNWDPDGADGGNLNGEWMKIKNLGAAPLDLGGWHIRDSFLRRYTFGPGTTLAPGSSLYVHAGAGADSASHLYWRQGGTVFENVTRDERAMGDGAYLYDPQGDLRSWFIYPCTDLCAADPARGAIQLAVEPRAPERMTLTNAGAAAVDLEGYVLKVHHGDAYSHVFNLESDALLAPGEQLVVWTAPFSPLSRLERTWDRPRNILADGGNAVDLRNLTDVLIDCDAWGRGRC